MDQHGITARKDEDISLAEFCCCHMFDRTNEAVILELVAGQLPSCTNTCNLREERPWANCIQDISIVLAVEDLRFH